MKSGKKETEKANNYVVEPLKFDHLEFDQSLVISWDDLRKENEVEKLYKIANGIGSELFLITYKNNPAVLKLFEMSSGRKKAIMYFENEIVISNKMHDKNVVNLIAVGQDPSYRGFLITEFAQLGNLQEFIRSEAKKIDKFEQSLHVFEKQTEFPSRYWIKIALDMAKGMEVLHATNVLHKDLTLKNILLTGTIANPVAMVADFGVSMFVGDNRNFLRGSMRHYPPESVGAKTDGYYTTKSDVYMFGMLLYEMLHRHPIFNKMSTSDVLTRVSKGERPPFGVPCSIDLKELIEKCWAQNPDERPSFIKIRVNLEKIYESRPQIKKMEEEDSSLTDDIVFEE